MRRLDLTDEQRRARKREQTRLRVQRYRERYAARGNATDSVTPASLDARTHAGAEARSTAFLVTPLPSVKEEALGYFEQVRCVLEPVRGYVHNERHLTRLAERYPDVDLVLEAIGMARWVNDNRRGNGCTEPFMTNWVKKASTRPAPKSALGRVLEQIATDPVAGPSTWH
jgi:hypothetical protein